MMSFGNFVFKWKRKENNHCTWPSDVSLGNLQLASYRLFNDL